MHCKCLGHETGGDESRAVQYADDSLGYVRVRSESLFISLKQAVRDYDLIGDLVEFVRIDNGNYHPHLPQHGKLYELSLAVWFAFQGNLEFTGCVVFRDKLRVKIPEIAESKTYILAWNKDRLQKASRVTPLEGEWYP